MRALNPSSKDLVNSLLRLSRHHAVCILDSCGVGHLGSHLMIAGIEPVEVVEISSNDPSATLKLVDDKLCGDLAGIFTISYDFGPKLHGLERRKKELETVDDPDVYLALFETLIVHDYSKQKTTLIGNVDALLRNDGVLARLSQELPASNAVQARIMNEDARVRARSNFTKTDYLAAVEAIKELIRDGDTYQTNLTQQLTAQLPDGLTPEIVFERIRRDHPAPFAAYIKRSDSTVVSASPERFFRVTRPPAANSSLRRIDTSPIKGTRHRGRTTAEDEQLRDDLLRSEKDRAENTMIVDLLRNDLGRVCEFGSIRVEKLCDLEEHPTLFHLVSTISGDLRDGVNFSDIIGAVFPCGSITGAPKISTMKIIDEIETVNRGLSMGAIGYHIPTSWGFGPTTWDLSVAIRTMVVRNNVATFNVGGGITIDSDPEKEYAESLLKAQALLAALDHRGTI